MKHFTNTLVLAVWIALTFHVTASNAHEVGIEPAGEGHVSRFADRQLLLDTTLGDAGERLAAAEQDMLAAQADSDGAGAGGTATPEEISALEAKQLEAADALAAVQGEIQAVSDLVAQLSDEQVFALNRSLNNALASDLTMVLDAALLQQVIDGDFDRQQINALVQGLEQEARFLAKRDRFEARGAAKAGEESLAQTDEIQKTDRMQRMELKADSQKMKFFAKIDDSSDPAPVLDTPTLEDAIVDDAGADAAKSAATDAAKEAASDTAKQIAKAEARLLAKAAATDVAKATGKSAAKREKDQTN